MQLMISNSHLIDSYQFTGFKDVNSWDLTNALTYYYEKMGKKNVIYIEKLFYSFP